MEAVRRAYRRDRGGDEVRTGAREEIGDTRAGDSPRNRRTKSESPSDHAGRDDALVVLVMAFYFYSC